MNLHGGLETHTRFETLLLLLPLLLLVLLLPPFRCVEVVAWPFVVIAVCSSCACSLIVKKIMLVEKKKLVQPTKTNLLTKEQRPY
jgi:hypothetical protein